MSLQNPEPILKQQKSKINTNPFIPDNQKTIELKNIQDETNKILSDNYNKNKLINTSLSDINKNISKTCIGIMNDLLNKPDNIVWYEYIQIVIKKDDRYAYLGIIFIIISLVIFMFKN